MRRLIRRRSTSSLVSPPPKRVPTPPRCCGQLGVGAAAQAGQAVAQQGQLDLGLALERVGVLGEDVEDHRGAVDGRAPEQLLQVVLLGRAELVVEHDGVGVDREAQLVQLLRPCPCRRTTCGRGGRGAAPCGPPRRRRRCRSAPSSSSRLASVVSSSVPGNVTPTSTMRSRMVRSMRVAPSASLYGLLTGAGISIVPTKVAGPVRVTRPGSGTWSATLASPPSMCTVSSPLVRSTSPQRAAAQAAARRRCRTPR